MDKDKNAHKKYRDKEKRREYMKQYYKKQNQLGFCRSCKNKRVTETVCEFHRNKKSMEMLKSHYNISEKEYNLLGKECMICGTSKTTTARLHVDHDHKTKKVRGILCSSCNNGIGRFKDNPDLLFKASEYLKK